MLDPLDPLYVCTSAWNARHVPVPRQGKGVMVWTTLVDSELAGGVWGLLGTPGTRLFRHEVDGEISNLTPAA